MKILVIDYKGDPLRIVEPKKAIGLLSRCDKHGKSVAVGIAYEGDKIRSGRATTDLPSVIQIVNFYNVPHRTVKWSKHKVFERDHWTCQYCGKKLDPRGRDSVRPTVDNVIPRSRFAVDKNPSTWGYTITSCVICNRKKARKTPAEAGMKLLSEPKTPRTSYAIVTGMNEIRETWKQYVELK